MIPWAMSGSSARTGMEAIVPAIRSIPPGPDRARFVSFVVAAGSTTPGTCVLPIATGATRSNATFPSASALPQVQPLGEPAAGGQGLKAATAKELVEIRLVSKNICRFILQNCAPGVFVKRRRFMYNHIKVEHGKNFYRQKMS